MDGFELGMFVLFILIIIIGSIDGLFIKPIAKDNANNHCIGLGFDQYKEMSRVGIFSTNPIAIKCEYAERYSDLGIRTNNP